MSQNVGSGLQSAAYSPRPTSFSHLDLPSCTPYAAPRRTSMACPGSARDTALAGTFQTPPASSATPSQHASPLPQPRRHALKPGGSKESDLIRYLDHGVNNVQKRVDNRLTHRKVKPAPGEEEGYGAFWEVAKQLDGLADVVWVSGSRTSPI